MLKATLIVTAIMATLTGCAAGGVNPDTPIRSIGPVAEGGGIFSGKDGKFTGTFGVKSFESDSEREAREAREAEEAARTGANDAEYQEWKRARAEEEYEAWKKAQGKE